MHESALRQHSWSLTTRGKFRASAYITVGVVLGLLPLFLLFRTVTNLGRSVNLYDVFGFALLAILASPLVLAYYFVCYLFISYGSRIFSTRLTLIKDHLIVHASIPTTPLPDVLRYVNIYGKPATMMIPLAEVNAITDTYLSDGGNEWETWLKITTTNREFTLSGMPGKPRRKIRDEIIQAAAAQGYKIASMWPPPLVVNHLPEATFSPATGNAGAAPSRGLTPLKAQSK